VLPPRHLSLPNQGTTVSWLQAGKGRASGRLSRPPTIELARGRCSDVRAPVATRPDAHYLVARRAHPGGPRPQPHRRVGTACSRLDLHRKGAHLLDARPRGTGGGGRLGGRGDRASSSAPGQFGEDAGRPREAA
jgi:hypothetical protein